VSGADHTSIVVTGGSGFIGSRLLGALGAEGRCVVSCGRLTSPAELDRLEAALSRRSQDRVGLVHLAGGYRTGQPWAEVFAANTGSVGRALDALGPRLDHVTFLSSVAVYGAPGSAPGPDPGTAYGRAKRLAEQLLGLFRAATGRPVAILRTASVYGEGNTGTNAVALLTRAVATRRPFVVHAAPQGRDYVHVDDVIGAVRCAVDASFDGTVDVGTGRSTTPAELADMATAAGFDVDVWANGCPGATTAGRFRCDTATARTHLRFRTAIALEDGLVREIRWRRATEAER